jgi:hypothetical protein
VFAAVVATGGWRFTGFLGGDKCAAAKQGRHGGEGSGFFHLGFRVCGKISVGWFTPSNPPNNPLVAQNQPAAEKPAPAG